jgi:hypothetical protein
LYSVRTSRGALARKFGLSDNRMAAFEPLPAIFPGHMAPIIKQSADGEGELVLRSWGFILLREGYAPKRVTNTRDDKVQTSFWKDSFEKRRCLVPATAFCEPDEGKPARWHWFALRVPERMHIVQSGFDKEDLLAGVKLAAPSASQCNVCFFEEAHVLLDVVTLFEKGFGVPLAAFGAEEVSTVDVDSAREPPHRVRHRVDDVVAKGFGIARAESFGACRFELAAAARHASPEDVILTA